MAEEKMENPEEQTTTPALDANDTAGPGRAANPTASRPAGQPAQVLAPKERRRAARAAKAAVAPARSVRTAQERHEERAAERRSKAGARRTGRLRARAKARAAEHSSEATAPRERAPGRQKSRSGIVTSDRADKTITVRIDSARRHRRYDKIVRTSTTLHVHDEKNEAHIGDTVIVLECRPLSRTKRWRLIEIVQRAE